MRDWSGRSNMEWFLMKILEDGAFLLDRAEDQNGTRFNLNEWTTKDQIAAEEFYERAINDLFQVIDDEDMTGIPEGLIELGNQILRKLDRRFFESTRSWLVYKWLFGAWLLNVVIHPEMHGLMMEYHITEYGRQKILKEVALRAQKLVFERTMSLTSSMGSKPVSTPPAIKSHIENIMNRFRGSETPRAAARLLPARSITSLRETVEVHPYLIVSPADLVTMVNALFPERRPCPAQPGGLRSGLGSVSSFSVISQPVAVTGPRSKTEAESVLSSSVSSANSDATTSVEPLESQQTGTSSYTLSSLSSALSGVDQTKTNHSDDDGCSLRLALQDMSQTIGSESIRGTCHPCAERWAVLFVSADGNSLSMQMAYDPDEYDCIKEDSTSSDDETDDLSEDELPGPNRTQPDMDYHNVRKCIFKLVEEYEIPPEPSAGNGAMPIFSNQAKLLEQYRMKTKLPTTETTASSDAPPKLRSRNPYLRRVEGKVTDAKQRPIHHTHVPRDLRNTQLAHDLRQKYAAMAHEDSESSKPVLISMLTAASSQSHSQSDFLSALRYWKTLQQLNAVTSPTLRQNGFAALLNIFSRGPRDSIRRSAAAVEMYEAWLIWLKQSQERAEGALDTMIKRLRALRDKMWYVTDVRNSAPYEFTRNIAVALKTMGTSPNWDTHHRSRQSKPRGGSASFLYRIESELVELLAATENQGGPNKLSDDQAEKTLRWLQHSGTVNFCQGEERIHRFSCEIASCIDKLVGESIVEAPVLWSSVLFSQDQRYLETTGCAAMRDRGGTGLIWDDATSIQSFGSENRRFNTPLQSSSSARGDRDFRPTFSQTSSSVQSFDSDQYSFSRASTSFSDIAGSHSYVSSACVSPVPVIDSPVTFWSPFKLPTSPISATSRAQSPTAAAAGLRSPLTTTHHSLRQSSFSRQVGGTQSNSQPSEGRPGTSASSAGTIFQQRVPDGKARFLNDLRQSLSSLLLSDLGNLVFARGSETDHWFGIEGQNCIDRREEIAERQRQEATAEKNRPTNKTLPKQTNIDTSERKKELSESCLSASGGNSTSDGDILSDAPSRQSHTSDMTTRIYNESFLVTSPNTATGPGRKKFPSQTATQDTTQKTAGSEFPFKEAYRRLLRMFCVHPNPRVKLDALCELENLITASLSSRSTRRRLAQLAVSSNSPVVSQITANDTSDPRSEETTADLNTPSNQVKPLDEAPGEFDNTKGAAQTPSIIRRRSFGAQGERAKGVGEKTNSSQTKDAVACILRSLFCDSTIRPKTLFRDLQFIAAFVPSDVLDRSERAKSFWAAGTAALLLKNEVCMTMIELTDEIIGAYTKTRQVPAQESHLVPTPPLPPTAPGDVSSCSKPSALYPASTPLLGTYSLADAARMLTITAKEGISTSQRELALFYLTNPELLERITLPLSKPREVFKKAVMDKYGGGGSGAGPSGSSRQGGVDGGSGGHGHGNSPGDDSVYVVRNDPALMCLAVHWMEAAEKGGDKVARTFLGQNEMMQ
ncbi:hypothetical protein SEPCBS57363_003973 [Sporothrix epigloea]|uniref:Uncharacterized protein n=1 Tax=Sporothrix epigloea TaxID=1892477 RepID=A0ABP0DTK0_9PEZI